MEYPVALTNPGAETGDTSGWTVVSGTLTSATGNIFPNSFGAYSGTRYFQATGNFYQSVTVDSSLHAAIDAGVASALFFSWRTAVNYDASLYLGFYDATATLISTVSSTATQNRGAWGLDSINTTIPVGTRTIRAGTVSTALSGASSSNFDDFSLVLSDTSTARASQAVGYATASRTAAQVRALQTPLLALASAETASGQFRVFAYQAAAYALVRAGGDRVDLRAWCFLQDDHPFYGLQLGNAGTIIHDLSTGQWAQWYSPGYAYWRVEDAVDWEGFNLGCDTENGTIWKIDPTGRLDAGTTVITSQVTGQATVRGRRTVPCYLAEIACSQAEPAAASGTSMQLRTSDDHGASWIDHGTVTGLASGSSTLFRYFGLGLMTAPGRVFEITNTGYARRIDGVDIEIGGDPNDPEDEKRR